MPDLTPSPEWLSLEKSIEALSRKIDSISQQIDAVRKEARDENEILRKSVVSQEVYIAAHNALIERVARLESIQERHQVALTDIYTKVTDHSTKVAQYDAIIDRSRDQQETWYKVLNDVSSNKERIGKLEVRGSTLGQKIYTTIATLAGVIAIILFLFQHIVIK